MHTGSNTACWHIQCDGTALPNPGRMGIGGVLRSPDGVCHEFSVASGRQGCNNEAEALAVLHALQMAQALGAQHLEIASDSSVLVQHLNNGKRVSVVHLRDCFDALRETLDAFGNWKIAWVPRHRNSDADRLARAALGLQVSVSKPSQRRK